MAFCPTSNAPQAAQGRAIRAWFMRRLDWAAQSRARRVLLLLAGIWLLNAFDLLLTVLAHQQGLLQEENPVGRYLLSLGVPSLVLFKFGLVLLGSCPLIHFRRARITEMAAFFVLVAYAMLAVHWSECYELYAFIISNHDHVVCATQATIPGS